MDNTPKTVRYVTIGNTLTASRLALLPVCIAGIALHIGWLAVAAMAAALLTDLIDGRISRKLGQASEFGANLDSSVDFLFLNLLFVAFYATHRIHTYQFGVVYIAMLVTLATQFAANIVSSRNKVMKTTYSKPTGAFEYLYLLFLVVRLVLPPWSLLDAVDLLIFLLIAVFVTLHIWESATQLRSLVNPADEEG